MENSLITRNRKRIKRAARVRRLIRGTNKRPRLSVDKSNRHLGVQLIDDESGNTLLALNTQMKEFRLKKLSRNKDAARLIGTQLGKLAQEKKIHTIVFDRGFHKFHGIIAELAQAAREAGLQF